MSDDTNTDTNSTATPAAAPAPAPPTAPAPVDVTALAGFDANQLKAVQTLVNDGVSLAKAADVIRSAAPAAVANTVPLTGAPRDTGHGPANAPDPTATFVELMKINPYAGARYGEAHGLIKRVSTHGGR